ncbi:MAG: BamA/TamA family outer membrane protein [Bacteroidota bacterium]|nr:BamA/TamA family outer membrane protein [Bacteroidota bacterium]
MRIIIDSTVNQKYKTHHLSKNEALKEVNNYILKLHQKSFLAASADSIFSDSNSIKAFIYTGNKYNYFIQEPDSNKSQKILSHSQFIKLENELVKKYENEGYPFVRVFLNKISISNDSIKANLEVEPGPLILFDSIFFETTKTRNDFMMNQLGLTRNSYFSQKKVKKSNLILKRISFIEKISDYQILFNADKAIVKYIVKDKKTNQVDGIIGLFPDARSPNKFVFSGEFNLFLNNLFKTGKSIKAEWRQFKPSSPILNIEYTHPFLFKSNIEIKANFYLLKDDTNFLNIKRKLWVNYNFKEYGKAGIIFGQNSSDVISSSNQKTNNQVSELNGYDFLYTGFNYSFNSTDDYYHPFNGWIVYFEALIGQRNLKKVSSVSDSVLQKLNLKTQLFSLELNVERYVKLFPKTILAVKSKNGLLSNDKLNLNELFRIGGLKSMRGFNENIFFANDYSINSLEVRQYIDIDSYLFAFYDQGVYYISTAVRQYTEYPIGFGAGITFTSKVGVFNLVYALGQSKALNQQISYDQSKIHFGYTSRF